MSGPILQITNVTKTYGNFRAVNDLNLSLPEGSIYGFLGPNGAGKTTTLRMVLDIIKPTKGTINILSHNSAYDVRNRIGYLPEEKGLYKKMKAVDVITYFAMLKGISMKDAKKKAIELLSKYGLEEFVKSKIEELSKGMSQKVQVLSSVAHDPDLVILDEPFSGLDPINQKVLEQLILDIAARGKTILFSTHVMQHAERICDHILLMAKGSKIFDGTIPEAKNQLPKRLYITVKGDIDTVKDISGVVSMTEIKKDPDKTLKDSDTNAKSYQIDFDESADPNVILQYCFEKKIPLLHFDQQEPTLHDVFVELVEKQNRGENLS